MKHTLTLILLCVCLVGKCGAQVQQDELQTIKQNYKNILLGDKDEKQITKAFLSMPREIHMADEMVRELSERYPIKANDVKEIIANLDNEGRWTDLDYENEQMSRSGWQPKIHLDRLLILAKAHELKVLKKVDLATKIHQALTYWLDKKYTSPNWWYNEIGAPKTLGAFAIVFENELTENEKNRVVDALAISKIGRTGQNRVWLAQNVLVRSLLKNDIDAVSDARSEIFNVVRLGDVEGVKADWSFHQHGAQQQFGNYGAAYLSTVSLWAKVFAQTPLRLDEERLDILYNLITKGYNQVMWKGYLDVNGLGRQLFSQSQQHKALSVAYSINRLMVVDAKNQMAYKTMLSENVFNPKQKTELTGLYHFWQSEQTIMRQPDWMASVKMSSNRVLGAESGNGDNQKGYYMADGATYIYKTGDEYYNIFPLWDWRKLPGVTAYESTESLKTLSWQGGNNKSDFVGNVNNGKYGMTVMQLNRDRLKGNKAWIFTPNYVLCLGTHLRTDSLSEVTTSIDQTWKKSELSYLNEGKWQVLDNMSWRAEGNLRFFHNKTGYVVLGKSNGEIREEHRTGDWKDIMDIYPRGTVNQGNILSLWIKHGWQPYSADYEYLILPQTTQTLVKDFDIEDIEVRENSGRTQFVFLPKENMYLGVAYSPQWITVEKGLVLKIQEPALFMLEKESFGYRLYVSDPTQKLEHINVEFNNRKEKIALPQGEMKGTTVEVTFNF